MRRRPGKCDDMGSLIFEKTARTQVLAPCESKFHNISQLVKVMVCVHSIDSYVFFLWLSALHSHAVFR
jgi:hypothetical protein